MIFGGTSHSRAATWFGLKKGCPHNTTATKQQHCEKSLAAYLSSA